MIYLDTIVGKTMKFKETQSTIIKAFLKYLKKYKEKINDNPARRMAL